MSVAFPQLLIMFIIYHENGILVVFCVFLLFLCKRKRLKFPQQNRKEKHTKNNVSQTTWKKNCTINFSTSKNMLIWRNICYNSFRLIWLWDVFLLEDDEYVKVLHFLIPVWHIGRLGHNVVSIVLICIIYDFHCYLEC